VGVDVSTSALAYSGNSLGTSTSDEMEGTQNLILPNQLTTTSTSSQDNELNSPKSNVEDIFKTPEP
jgi:hypothetical protein